MATMNRGGRGALIERAGHGTSLAIGLAALALLAAACGANRGESAIDGLSRSERDGYDSGYAAGPMEGGSAADSAGSSDDYELAAEVAGEPSDSVGGNVQAIAQSATSPQEGAAPSVGGLRKIIKDGVLTLRVEDVALGIARMETIAAQSGGYAIETTTDYRDAARRSATVKMAVPVANFEAALERVRQAALAIESESASGTDVSGEVVDLRAQLANLEATSARVRSFLDQAKTVEEALKVNAQLTELEGDIAQRKGRLEYLEQRAAFSTITVTLTEPTPDWTPTATATPWPTATPVPWRPGETVRDATGAAGRLGRGLGDLFIWLAIVVLPFGLVALGALAAFVWVIRRFGGRSGGGAA